MTPAGKRASPRRDEVTGRSGAPPDPAAPGTRARKRDAARTQRLRTVIRYMLEHGTLATGGQVLLATHFNLSRQRVNQLVARERALMKVESVEADDAGAEDMDRPGD
jgi:hypothetical protein